MSENQTRLERALYDHEHEEPRTSGGRRRRPVADWGVGDDVFESMPRNRFSRASDGPPRERRFAPYTATDEPRPAAGDADVPDHRDWFADADADDRAPAAHDEGRDDDLSDRRDRPGAAARAADVPRDRPAAARAGDVPRGRVGDGRRTIVIGRPEDVPSEIAAITADRDIGDDPLPADEPAERPATAPGERRTIRIGGRPEGSLEATRAQRRRPPRTAHERVGARPDRVAAWAVALGVLLILIAVLSAL